MSRKRIYPLLAVICITAVYLSLCLYRLNDIPGEWFGDISIENSAVQEILSGTWPWHFSLSAGPLYHYFAAVFVKLSGISYLTYKYASVSMGLLGLIAIGLFAGELFSAYVGMLAAGIGAVSFWYLVWARLGNSPQIISPFLTGLTFYLALKYKHTGKSGYLFLGGFVSGLGLVSYPALYLLPVAWLAVILTDIITGKTGKRLGKSLLALLPLLPGILIFYLTVKSSPGNFLEGGYVGSKLPDLTQGFFSLVSGFLQNLGKTAGMFSVRGDIVFRINVPGKPHLDILSGSLMYLGIVMLFVRSKYRKYAHYLILPPLFLVIPSVSPSLPPIEIPSSGRTFGIVPFVFTLTALGISELSLIAAKIRLKYIRIIFSGICLALILISTINTYFYQYPDTLPNHNSPFGKIIAEYIDHLPPKTEVYLVGCCWGDWGQPEPNGIYYMLKNQTSRDNFHQLNNLSDCSLINEGTDRLIILNPHQTDENIRFQQQCFPGQQIRMVTDKYNQPVFTALPVAAGK
jgi:4-amino-4-deoxy-L-arabinose transferase-like glycosyltransferase